MQKNDLSNYSSSLVAVIEGKIVGFCAGQVTTSNNAKIKEVLNESSTKKIGILDILVTNVKHREKGIGTALFQQRMKELSFLKI